MKLDGFLNKVLDFISRITNRDDTWKVGNVSSPRCRALFVNDRIPDQFDSFRPSPALRRIARSVHTGTPLPG